MALCGICETNESKYKCSKCLVPYCSLVCYKSSDHKHDETTSQSNDKNHQQSISPVIKPNLTTENDDQSKGLNETYRAILADEKFQYYLNHPIVQRELVKINQIIQSDRSHDFHKSNEYLLNLRKFGKNENVLIEEFCCMFTALLQDKESTSETGIQL
ncbi:hypothetical protein WICPIJ_008028 [Wickerhamomyces pijperi]|uniref:HIT-type domain-containing protein n=1 Tax=Wickerhamomyces pijperi TaxID=599730 RepID=A0A9P8PZ15_WICPI|nr:hypothetical protein WICPIJ_008028 [Wickerhamomyces pijperi]